MPYSEVPDFIIRLKAAEAMTARALEFLILTDARSGEVLNAKWNLVDLSAGVWNGPGSTDEGRTIAPG